MVVVLDGAVLHPSPLDMVVVERVVRTVLPIRVIGGVVSRRGWTVGVVIAGRRTRRGTSPQPGRASGHNSRLRAVRTRAPNLHPHPYLSGREPRPGSVTAVGHLYLYRGVDVPGVHTVSVHVGNC